MAYDYVPTHWDGTSLTAAPFESVVFDPDQWPVRASPHEAVEATVVGFGQEFVRSQPLGVFTHLRVFLSATNEADLNTLMQTFDPIKGLVFLRVDDGTGTPINYRVEAQTVGIDREAANVWLVRIRVPYPFFEQNTLQSDSVLNVAADTGAVAVVNDGNRRARPVLKCKHDTVKNTIVHDWKYSIRSVMVNRTPNALTNYAVNVAADDDGGQVIDTAGLIHQTGGPHALVNNVAGITAAATEIDFDTEAGGGLDTPDGMIFIDTEQIYYTGKTATQLTGCVRGIGGTTAATHANNASITRSRMLDNGDDIAVWVDGKKVPDDEVWLADIDTANTKIWINISASGRVTKTLSAAMTGASPADGGDIQFDEDISDLPESGVVCIGYDVLTGMEAIAYRSRDLAGRKIKTIERAAWGTTAFTWGKGTKAALAAHLIVIGYGKATAASRPAGLDRRPAIQLSDSTNNQWRYGDQADDANTVFWDSVRPNRSAMWLPDFQVPAADNNHARALSLLALSPTIVDFREGSFIAERPAIGRLKLDLPSSVQINLSPAITYDVQERRGMRLRILGRSPDGAEEELVDRYSFAESLLTARTIDTRVEQRIDTLILNGVRAAAAAQTRGEVEDQLNAANNRLVSKLIIDDPTLIEALHLKLRKDAAGNTFTFNVWLTLDTNSAATTKIVGRFMRWSGGAETNGDFPASALTTGMVEYAFYPASGVELFLEAGTYYIFAYIETFTSGIFYLQSTENPNTKHVGTNLNGTDRGGALYFALIHPGAGPIEKEVGDLTVSSGSVGASLDKFIIELDDDTADERTPFFAREGTGASPLFHTNGILSSDRNTLTLTFDAWLKPATDFEVDCAARTVTFVDGQHRISMPGSLTPSDEGEWFQLYAGTNNLTWTEENMSNFDLVVEHRGAKS